MKIFGMLNVGVFNRKSSVENKKTVSVPLRQLTCDTVEFSEKSRLKKLENQPEKAKVEKQREHTDEEKEFIAENNKSLSSDENAAYIDTKDRAEKQRELTDEEKEFIKKRDKALSPDEISAYIDMKDRGESDFTAYGFAVNHERYQRLYDLIQKGENGTLPRPLNKNELINAAFANSCDKKVLAYIELKDAGVLSQYLENPDIIPDDTNEINRIKEILLPKEGKSKFSEKIDFDSAKNMVTKGFDDSQIQRAIDISDRFAIPVYEACKFVLLEYDDKIIERYFKLNETGLRDADIKSIVENDNAYTRYLKIYEKFHDKLCNLDILEAALQGLDEDRILKYIELINGFPFMGAFEIAKSDESIARYNDLLAKNETLFSNKLGRNDYSDIIKNGLSDEQIKLALDISESCANFRAACVIAKDSGLYNRFLHYRNTIDEYSLVLMLARGFSDKQIEAYPAANEITPLMGISYAEAFGDYADVKNIDELTADEKRGLLNSLINNSLLIFEHDNKAGKFSIIPNNEEECSSLLSNLINAIGKEKAAPLDDKTKKDVLDGINHLCEDIKTVDIDSIDISLDFSRDEFKKQVLEIAETLPEEKRKLAFDYYNFQIKDLKLIGYPALIERDSSGYDIETLSVIENLRPVVQKFSENNRIVSSDSALEQDLNNIFKGLSELNTLIAKPQHGTHKYTLDKHTLAVLKNAVLSDEYKELNDADKKILSAAILLHDISKAEGAIDEAHPLKSALDAYFIIQKMGFSEEENDKIYTLIKTHEWLKDVDTAEDKENAIKDTAFNTRNTNTFELAKILCKADLKSVNDNFYEKFENDFHKTKKAVDGYLKQLKESQILIPQTKIPNANELKGETLSADGITNTVIDLKKAGDDLSCLGFEKGTKKSDFSTFVHALSTEEQLMRFSGLTGIDTNSLLSVSAITPDEHSTFKPDGLIIECSPSNVFAGYYKDIHSGYTKNISEIKEHYLFPDKSSYDYQENAKRYRGYIPDLVKSKMNISDKEYAKLMEEFTTPSSFLDIKSKNEELYNALKAGLSEFHSLTNEGGQYGWSEFLTTRPKIKGVFSTRETYDEIPQFLRKYAQDNNIPIILY